MWLIESFPRRGLSRDDNGDEYVWDRIGRDRSLARALRRAVLVNASSLMLAFRVRHEQSGLIAFRTYEMDLIHPPRR